MKRVHAYGWNWKEELHVSFDDGERVILVNDDGNVMMNCSKWLFEECRRRGFLVD